MKVQDRFSIVLVEPRYDGNIGSVARVMKNFGFNKLVLVRPPKIGSEARKNSMHAMEILGKSDVYKSFGEAIEDFDFVVGTTAKVAGDGNKLRTPVYVEELSVALDTKGKIALVFGREDYGLLNEELELCDMLVTIPANYEYPTLNLAHSVGIVLYEVSRQANKETNKKKKFRMLSKIEKDTLLRFYDGFVEKMLDYDFEINLAKRTFRSIVGRAFISGREAKTMTGVFRRGKEKAK
ncbi:MAG: RNA methyltransferase [Candidatus Altiarchaeota archaeon]|nr:RNA methyltransferase [Candidatus Altiarchaeota archaeon]